MESTTKQRNCVMCANGIRGHTCINCGRIRAPVATINHTGRYWYPMIQDIKRVRDVGLSFDGKGVVFKDYDRSKPPVVGLPVLFNFPGPYHPLELLSAYRGFGGAFGSSDLSWSLPEINRARTSYSRFVEVVMKHLFWPESTVHVMYHLLTPQNTNYLENDPTPGLRGLLYSQIGIDATNAVKAWQDAKRYGHFDQSCLFWGNRVKGTVEL